jgi:hypothetical protein
MKGIASSRGAGMSDPRRNPQAKNLVSVIGYPQKQAGIGLHVPTGPG